MRIERKPKDPPIVVLFLTNCPDFMDKAFIRSGRVGDATITLGLQGAEKAVQMTRHCSEDDIKVLTARIGEAETHDARVKGLMKAFREDRITNVEDVALSEPLPEDKVPVTEETLDAVLTACKA